MDGLSGLQLGLLLLGLAALAALGGWVVRHRRARGESDSTVHEWQTRVAAQFAESQALTRSNAQQGSEIKTLKSLLGTATIAREAAEAALTRRTQDLERASTMLRRATAELAARDLQLDEMAQAAAALAPLRKTLVERDQLLDQTVRQRQTLGRRVEELTRVRAKLESEGMQLAVRVESLERDLEVATAAARLKAAEHRHALEARQSPVAPAGGHRSDRLQVLTKAAEKARGDAAHGALAARAERGEALVRQLEDRDALLRAATFERDQVSRRAVEAEREQRKAADALADALRRLAAADALAEDRLRRGDATGRKTADSMRERDEARALARRLSLEAETLRAELRARDGRFRTLARETDARVQELNARVAELESELYLTNTLMSGSIGGPGGNGAAAQAGDNLASIASVGPDLALRLGEQGITTFRQIADWSDDDIDRIAPLIGALPDTIRREQWVGRAREAMTGPADG